MNRSRRSLASLAAGLLVAAPLTACGGEDGEGLLPTPTRSITVSPTRTPSLPTPTRTPSESPAPTEEPSEEPTEQPTEEPPPSETPAESPTPTETVTVTESPSPSEEPTETPTPTPTETATPTESPSPTESTDPDEAGTEADEEEDPAPAWVWWLLGLTLLAAAIGIPLYLWLKRRNGWRDDLEDAEAELAWLARSHLPELRQKAGSPDRVAGGWEVAGEGRASAAEDKLTALEASAPDDDAAARARALRDGVRAARLRLSGLEALTSAEAVAGTLDAAIADLEGALSPPAGSQS